MVATEGSYGDSNEHVRVKALPMQIYPQPVCAWSPEGCWDRCDLSSRKTVRAKPGSYQ